MTHSFYAGMGGFFIGMDNSDVVHGAAFIPDRSRLYLTARGAQLLAECGLLPNMSLEEIKDKSKTDGSEKLLCCLQAGWMLFQTVTRLVVGLPVTPLEINTIGHVLCALSIFILCGTNRDGSKSRQGSKGSGPVVYLPSCTCAAV